jgi:hypothetical protein
MNRRRWLLLAAPLCVVVGAASVAFAAPSDTEHAGDAELDDPHAERPIAASDHLAELVSAPLLRLAAIDAHLQRVRRADLENFFLQVSIGDFLASVAADEEARAAEAVAVAAPAPPDAGPAPAAPGGALACIRAHESDTAGGYAAVSGDGTYRGAYQFLPSTWNATAAEAGRPDLVGVDPASASPADQDAIASYLYAQAGSQPWGGRC